MSDVAQKAEASAPPAGDGAAPEGQPNGAAADAATAPAAVRYPVVCPGHARPVVDVRFSRHTEDGVFLVSGCHDKLPMLRWGDNGDWIGSFDSHKGAVWSAAFNSDATKVVTGSGDFAARLLDAVSGKLIHTFEHKHVVKTVEFSKDDQLLLTGGKGKTLRVFDLSAPDYTCLATMDTKVAIRKASWVYNPKEPNSKGKIVCGCEDGSVQVWNPDTPDKPVQEWKVGEDVKDLEVSESQGVIVVGAGKSVYFYDLVSFKLIRQHDLKINVEGLSLNPVTGAQFVAGGDTDLWVHVFDTETGKELSSHTGHHGPIFCLRYHPDGEIFASGSEDGTVRLWKPTLETPKVEE
eukprot:CAMPEP_0184541958 /NCGR_PEP_ID=MMETSP0199_2-20130426/1710_1 /TAXON_ID=1112570 /ORGANISM="Thraustochytrium sp., Strain LLF1b" /LENGTH=348 /DNA_ID=CAMNT_0026935715 /DNA_START=38 /DNA_END=1084 /DNA_ORIENTATION=-